MPAFSEPVENPMIRMEPEPTVPELPHPTRVSGLPNPYPPSTTEALVRKVSDPWGPIGQADGADGFDTPPEIDTYGKDDDYD